MAGKLRINADGCHLMARHLYLWYHLDVMFGCVCHKLLHLLLGVIALDRHQHVVHVPTAACLGCQSRIFLDLDAPTLVVHEVEMHGIELVASHLWDECLELVEWDEGSHWVEHQLSDMRAWLIGYGGLHDGIAALLGAIATEQLVEGHQTIEYTSGCLSLDDNFLSLYVELVGFWVIKAFVQCQGEGELLRFVHLALVDSLALYLALFKNLLSKYSLFTINKWMFTWATIVIWPFTIGHVGAIDFASVPMSTWWEAGYVIFFGTYLGYICMMIGQKTLRPTVVSVYNYVQPVVSVSVSVMASLAVFKGMQAFAALLIFSGVWLVVKSKSKRDMEKEEQKLAKSEA